jgi:methyltransferase
MYIPIIAAIVFGFLIVEARLAAAHERLQLARGGVEAPGDVYAIMRLAYPGAFLAMLVEGSVRPAPSTLVVGAGAALFALAKALKWWAILSLGPAWTFRVVVVPGAALVKTGPYRLLRHPNYVAVAGELAAVAVLAGARVSGPIATAIFCLLMLRRVVVENRALDVYSAKEFGIKN